MLKSFHIEGAVEAGCDEAGRGCIAGPVFAAAVILPLHFSNPVLDDSKKLSAKKRLLLRPLVEQEALAWGVGVVHEKEIDQINILNASFLAMHRALDKLQVHPSHLLIDGNRFRPYGGIAHSCIVKGDGIFASVAAASLLAKTHRGEYVLGLHQEYPHYAWNKNMGYPTREHRKGLLKHGPTPYHRRSFKLLDDQTRLEFS
ncbi:MAG: ribonuclease HII [Bacteroidetes bacterium]|nr:MAG: ribonuclease HII [Bacteroidota bacterium]